MSRSSYGSRDIHAARYGMSGVHSRGHGHYARYGRIGGGLQCVPFARENSGIELSGNASTWWAGAAGVYQRGSRPEVGSVMNFRANGHMRMGHVAVVTAVLDSRKVEIDHANWAGPGAARGGISRDITVVDVSERNDWTAVRVALGHSGDFGSVYPIYGFIYDRPDAGTMVANANIAPAPLLNAAPRDLRPDSDRYAVATAAQDVEEVAEAEDDMQPARGSFRQARRMLVSHSYGSYARGSSFAHGSSYPHGSSYARTSSYAHAYSTGYGRSSARGYASHATAGYQFAERAAPRGHAHGRDASVQPVHATTTVHGQASRGGRHHSRT